MWKKLSGESKIEIALKEVPTTFIPHDRNSLIFAILQNPLTFP